MKREKKDNSQSYPATIRTKKKDTVFLRMTETFMNAQSAKCWVKKCEGELKTKGAVDKSIQLNRRKTWSDVIIDYCEAFPDTFGKIKSANLAYIQRLDFGEISVEDTDARTFFSSEKDLLIGVQAPPADTRKDSPEHYALKLRLPQTVSSYNVTAPNLIGSHDCQLTRQIGIDPILRVLFAGIWTLTDGLQSHDVHQEKHPMTTS